MGVCKLLGGVYHAFGFSGDKCDIGSTVEELANQRQPQARRTSRDGYAASRKRLGRRCCRIIELHGVSCSKVSSRYKLKLT
jgi:hypothetical protein